MTGMQHPPPPADLPPRAAPAKGGGLAVAALVLGLCSLIPFIGGPLGLTAIILGIIALVQKTVRKTMATVGIAVGAVGMLLMPGLLLAILLPSLGRARELAKRSVCATQLSSVGKACAIYVMDYDTSPPDLDTLMAHGSMPANVLKCPSADGGRQCDYFYLDIGPPMGVRDPTAAIMACDYKGNHEDGRNVLYVDGHVEWLTEAQFQAELASPENAAFAAALREAEGP